MKDLVHEAFYKPIVGGVVAGVADRYVLKSGNVRNNVAFGVAVAGGFLVADVLSSYALPKSEFKTLENRVMEVGAGTLSAVAMDRLVISPNVFRNDTGMRVGVIIGSEIVANYTRDIMYNNM